MSIYYNPNDQNAKYMCGVCWSELPIPIVLRCGHVFDIICLSQVSSQSSACPMCRVKFTAKDLDLIRERSLVQIEENNRQIAQLERNLDTRQIKIEVVMIRSTVTGIALGCLLGYPTAGCIAGAGIGAVIKLFDFLIYKAVSQIH